MIEMGLYFRLFHQKQILNWAYNRTSATLRKITDLRIFLHQYYALLRTSVTLLKFVTELRNTPYGAA